MKQICQIYMEQVVKSQKKSNQIVILTVKSRLQVQPVYY